MQSLVHALVLAVVLVLGSSCACERAGVGTDGTADDQPTRSELGGPCLVDADCAEISTCIPEVEGPPICTIHCDGDEVCARALGPEFLCAESACAVRCGRVEDCPSHMICGDFGFCIVAG